MNVQLTSLRLPSSPVDQCQDALLILEYAHLSAVSLLKLLKLSRQSRGQQLGTTTDEEQDLLRAMLVMAGAGLDAMAKQLVRDALPALIANDQAVKSGLEKFIQRQITSRMDAPELIAGARFLAKTLAAPSPQRQVIDDYVRELTGGSLQAVEELYRICDALGLPTVKSGIEKKQMAAIFEVRNQIIHDFDMDVAGDRRKRIQRRLSDMRSHVDCLFRVAQEILTATNDKLKLTFPT
jgi:hypothetical protein